MRADQLEEFLCSFFLFYLCSFSITHRTSSDVKASGLSRVFVRISWLFQLFCYHKLPICWWNFDMGRKRKKFFSFWAWFCHINRQLYVLFILVLQCDSHLCQWIENFLFMLLFPCRCRILTANKGNICFAKFFLIVLLISLKFFSLIQFPQVLS